MKNIELKSNKLIISYDFTNEHSQALFQVYANDGYAAFDNRDPNISEDIDGNTISWKICDELVDMGLLYEDEEANNVYFEISNEGINLLKSK